jgi:hypothetical protein
VLNIQSDEDLLNLTLIDATGKVVYSRSHTLKANELLQINVADLAQGVYLLTAVSADDQTHIIKVLR